jgi:epoxyqueuosine reductase QueG
MNRGQQELRDRLSRSCKRRGAAAFGIASAEEADAIESIKIGSTVNRWSEKIRDTIPHAKSVIVFGVRSQDDADELAIMRGGNNWSYPGYHPLTHMRRDALQILREEGYKAAPIPGLASMKRIAILAGIGAYGKNSMILSPRHGLWLRLEGVVTDAELPLNRPFAKNLCGSCNKCVKACPTKAIKPFVLDANRCLVDVSLRKNPPRDLEKIRRRVEYQITPRTHVMCTICQRVCPYTSAERRKNRITAPREAIRV